MATIDAARNEYLTHLFALDSDALAAEMRALTRAATQMALGSDCLPKQVWPITITLHKPPDGFPVHPADLAMRAAATAVAATRAA